MNGSRFPNIEITNGRPLVDKPSRLGGRSAGTRSVWARSVAVLIGAVVLSLVAIAPAFAQSVAVEDMLERQIEIQERMDELSDIDNLTPEQQSEMERLVAEWDELEQKIQSALKNEPKPTAAPRASPTPKPRATPAPRATKPTATPQPKNKAKPTPTPRPRRNVGRRSGAKDRINRNVAVPPTKAGAAGGEVELSTELNELAENLGRPYDERTYEFSIVDGTYAELIEAFARMSGVEVIGTAPDGTVSFTSKRKMDFKTALGRIQMLLFEHPQKYWIQLRDVDREPYLNIARIAEGQRILNPNQIFPTVQQYRERNLDDNDLALLQFTPEKGSIAEIEFLRDFMPDYVLISQKEGENALLVFGLVRDINKYLLLVEKFEVTIEDPRQIVIIPIDNIAPSDALELLKQLMDGFGNVTGAPARVRRPGQPSVAEAWAEKVTAIPFDDQGTLLVKAMPNKIEEIKRLLPFVDLPVEVGEPVIVPLEHASATDIITIVRSVMNADGGGAPGPRNTRRTRNRAAKSNVPNAPQVFGGQELTMIDWSASNSIILIGSDEEVADAKALIKRFDVPDDKDIVQVDLMHRDGNELAQQVTQIAQILHPGSAARLSCTASPDGGALILAGPLMEIEGAKAIIEKLDIEPVGPPEHVHTYELKYVQPSQVVNILNSWDASETGEAAATTTPRRRSRRRAANATGSKFLPDDMRGVIYVVCTQEEWVDRYQPVIAQLDQELEAPDFKLIPLTNIDSEDALHQITLLFAATAGKGAGPNAAAPKCIAVPGGVMVLDASEAQMASITTLIKQIDVDLLASGQRQKRTFELTYADPAEVIERLKELVASPVAARKGQPAAPGGANDTLFINHRDSVIVWAPTKQMAEIAELIEQLDAAVEANILKSYTFEPGVDVEQLANTLTSFFEEASPIATPAAGQPQTKRPARRNRPARPASATTADEPTVTFIPQPASRRIVVSAPPNMFEEIESVIEMLRPGGPNTDAQVIVQFFDVQHGDATAIAQMVEPIIQVKLTQMIASSEITLPLEGKVPSVKVSADAASSRIVAAAPAILMPDIQQMIERFDGGKYGKQITRRVQLTNAKAEDVVEVVKVMLDGGTASSPVRRAKINVKGQPGQPQAPVSAAGENISVVPALSGDAVVLVGFEEQVDEVEGWIRELDESTPDEFEIKVFRNLSVDVETLADEILTILDKPAPSKTPAKSEGEDDFFSGFDDFWDVGGPRCGSEICLTTNPFNNLLVVRTTTEKMRAVEQWVDLYTREEEPITAVDKDLRPKVILELKYADAYDAVYDLENLIDVVWSGDKPSIKKVPYENMLLVRAKTEKDLDEVKALVAKYIDKEPEGGSRRVIRTMPVKGASADLVLMRALPQLEGMDVEIEEETSKGLLIQLKPNRCVLPSDVAIRAAELTTAAVLLQAKVDESENKEKSATEQQKDANQMLLDLLEKSGALTEKDEDSTEATEEKPTDAPAEKPKIRIDWRTNTIIVSGGSSSEVEAIEDIIDDARRDLEDVDTAPDIRVYQLEYIDPNIASQVLGAMFNVANRQQPAGRLTPQQIAAQRQQLQKQMQQQLQQKLQQQKGGGEQESDKGGRGEKGKEGEGEETPSPGESSAQQSIRVFPYPALRALIVSAPTEMFPAIEELVATIDRKREVPPEYRFFPLKNQLASDVEQMLKIMLGLDEQSQRTARGGRNTDPAVQAVAEMMKAQLNLPVTGPEGEIVSSSESITITSNDNTNTVMAVAPVSVLDLIGQIIDELEEQDIPPIETRKYDLKFANATVIVPLLEQLFAATGRGKGGGQKSAGGSAYNPSEVSQYVSFHADESNNAVFVRGVARDFEKIEPVIKELDIKTGGDVISFELVHANAEDVARALGQVYENRGPRGGGSSRIHFVGDRSSNTLFARAPEELREEVTAKIELMDRLATSSPKVVPLQFGNASNIADTLERVYGGGRGGSDRVRISGDEATRQLLVVAPDELFDKIVETAKKMDVKEDLDIQVFKLKHAKATDVLESMQQLVRDAMRTMSRTGGGSQMGPFSATADERTNSIAVMGGPLAFAMVAKVLADVDVPAEEASGKSVHVVSLNYAEADGVVRSLREVFRGTGRGPADIDVSSPQGTNALLINATEQEFAEIRKVIDQLDVLPGDEDRTARMITLKHTDAAEMVTIVEDYLAKPNAGGRGRGNQDLTGGIRVSALESTNSLVITGDETGIGRVAALVEKIDVEVEAGTAPKIIKLANAVASEIEPTISAMFQQGAPGGNRRGGGRGAQSGGMSPVIVADDGANALIVRATPADYQLIENLAADLDQQQAESGDRFKLIQLASAYRAADLAPTVEAAMREATATRSPGRGGRFNRGGGGGQSQLTVEPITASNSLLMTGDPKDLELAEAVVAMIQKQGPAGGKRTLILRPNNVSPDELERVINSMLQENNSQGSRSGRQPRRRR